MTQQIGNRPIMKASYNYRDAFVQSDERLLRAIINKFSVGFNRILKKKGATNEECKDCFAEALKVLVETFILDPNKNVPDHKFFNYLVSIGVHKFVDLKKKKSPDIVVPPFEETFDLDFTRIEEHSKFMKMFYTLGEGCQSLLWKKIVLQYNYEEIAKEIGKSPGYLRVQLGRCKDRLNKLLNR